MYIVQAEKAALSHACGFSRSLLALRRPKRRARHKSKQAPRPKLQAAHRVSICVCSMFPMPLEQDEPTEARPHRLPIFLNAALPHARMTVPRERAGMGSKHEAIASLRDEELAPQLAFSLVLKQFALYNIPGGLRVAEVVFHVNDDDFQTPQGVSTGRRRRG